MNILIPGGTKFIGPFVVRELAELGHEVTIFHRGETEQDLPPSVRHVHGDFADFNEHVDALRGLSPEVVLDMAPFRAEDEALRRTIDWERKNPPEKIGPAEFNYDAEDAVVSQLT